MASKIISHLNVTGWTFSEYVTAEIKAAGLAAVHKVLEGRGLKLASGTKVIVSYKKQYGNKGAYQASWSLAPETIAKPVAVAEFNIAEPVAKISKNQAIVSKIAKPVTTKPAEFDMAAAFNVMMLANEKTAKQIAALSERLDDME